MNQISAAFSIIGPYETVTKWGVHLALNEISFWKWVPGHAVDKEKKRGFEGEHTNKLPLSNSSDLGQYLFIEVRGGGLRTLIL